MKAEELRIGNWIEDKEHFKGYFQVEGVAKYTVQSPLWTLELDDIAPIPLTEDWLCRCGFSKQSMYFYYDTSYRIEQLLNGEYCFRVRVNGSESHPIAIISKLHQLQNLYHALTGEELTIKNQ